ncbi:MAG: hypothetical protein PHO07_15795, partial [Pirellulales bacterium]|nr:hypothetical protein [Pirellulales bacterium]
MSMIRSASGWLMAIVAAAAVGRPAAAQRMEAAPDELSEVGVEEHLNARLPLELAFTDSSAKPVTLGEFFDNQRPVILTL